MARPFYVDPPLQATSAAVIANGPSLRGIDLKQLPAVATFGMNAAYRSWNRMNWCPTHYACLDEVVGLSHADAIAEMIGRAPEERPQAFLLRANLIERLGVLGELPCVINYDQAAAQSRMLSRQPVTTGSHTLIWALTLGFETVFLLGADCNYVEIVPGAEKVSENVLRISRMCDNPNYYFEDYQQVGDTYHRPNILHDAHLKSWHAAAAVAAEFGAVVYNLSPVSKINVFDFVNYDQWLSGQRLEVVPTEW